MFKFGWLHVFWLGILTAQLTKAQEDPCPDPPCTGSGVIYEPPPPVDMSKGSFKPRALESSDDPCPNPPCTGYGVIYEPPPPADTSKGSFKPRAPESSDDPCPNPPCTGYGVIYEPPPSSETPALKPRIPFDDPNDPCPNPPCTGYGVIYEPSPPADLSKSSFKPRAPEDDPEDPCPNPPCTGYGVIYEPPPSPNAPALKLRVPEDLCSDGEHCTTYAGVPYQPPPAPTPVKTPPSPVEASTSTTTASSSSKSSSSTSSSSSPSVLTSSSSRVSSSTSSSSSSSSVFTSSSSSISSSTSSSSSFSSSSDNSFLTFSSIPTSSILASSTVSSHTATTTTLPLPTYISSSAFIFPTGGTPVVSQNGTDPSGTRTTACGPCNVYANKVRLYYWPTAAVNSQCRQGPKIRGIATSPGSPPSITAQPTQSMKPLNPAGGVDVVDGFTFTYPSTYLSVIGELGVTNACGPLGKTLDSPPPIAVNAIWTASYADWPSTCRPQARKVEVVLNKIQLSDIACPTWGLSNPFPTECDGTVYRTATVGPPYNPVILVPNELYNYDPAWSGCNEARKAAAELPCGLYDPPKALNIQQVLGPQPTLPSGSQSLPTPAAPGGGTGYDSPVATPPAAPLQPETLMAPLPQVTKPSLDQENGPESSQNQEPRPNDGPGPSPPTPQPQAESGSTAKPSSGPMPNPQNSPNQQNNPSPKSDAPDDVNSEPNSQPDPAAQSHSNAETNPQDRPDANTQGEPSSSGEGSNDPGTGPELKAKVPAQQSASPPNIAVLPRPIAQTTVAIGGTNSVGNSGGTSDDKVGGSQGSNPGPNLNSNAGGTPSRNALAGTTVAGLSPFTPYPVTLLGQTLSAINPSAVVIASKTLTAGGRAFSTNGNYYSVGPSGSLVAGTLAPGTSQLPVLTFGKSIYTGDSASKFVIGSQTLNPGQQITVSGTPISLAPSSNILVIGSSTQSLGAAAPTLPPALLTFGGSTYTADKASQFVIGSQTLAPGHQITVSGTPISEASGGSFAVIASSITQSLAKNTAGFDGSMTTPPPALLTFAGSTYTANPSSSFVVGDQTLAPGSIITVSGTAISEAPSGSGLVVIGGSTQVLSHSPTEGTLTTAAVMTFAGQTYTADASSNFVISGQTLKPGSMITIAGTPISEAPDATNVVIHGSTEVLSTATTSPSVMSFFGSASSHSRGMFSSWMIWFGWFIALLSSSGWLLLGL